MENEIEQNEVDITNDENLVVEETEDTHETESAPKKEFTTEQKLARVERLRAKYFKELGIEPESKPKAEPVKTETKGNTGESDIESLLLEVKGIQDSDEIALFEKWKADTGRPARQVLSNDIFQKELSALRAEKAVKDATPSSTKRGGSQTNDVAAALAKFEQTGQLPTDFELQSAVVNALEAKTSPNIPAYKRR